MASKQAYLLLLVGVLANPSLQAQQPAPPTVDASSSGATINCHGQSYVSLTADAEQAYPLQVVATLHCDEQVSILSDPQGYTVKVRTAGGKIGYVTRFEVTTASMKSGLGETPADSKVQVTGTEPASGESHLDAQEKTSSKPQIYVSDTESWMASGGFGNPSSVAPGNLYGGYNPEMVDIYQDFTSDCSTVSVTQEKSKRTMPYCLTSRAARRGFPA